MADELETWKNPTAGRVWVNRLNHRGELDKVEIIGSGRTFHLSTQERRLNQEMAYNADLDVFANGTLAPVRLLEGSDDAREFASNPNLITEADMRGMVKPAKATKATADAFVDRLETIRNPATLERLLTLAREEDAPLSRVEAIQGRLAEVSETPYATTAVSKDSYTDNGPGGSKRDSASRAVTPR